MHPKVVFHNTLFFRLTEFDFTDHYPDSTYYGTTIELVSLASSVPVYAGNFHVHLVSSFGLSGFFMLSRASRPIGDRRPYPRIGVPSMNATPPIPVAVLPEVVSEYIGSGLICDIAYVDSPIVAVSVSYRFRLQESLLLTLAVDSSSWPDGFFIGVLLSFDSSFQLRK
jgi:hypothetical protein